MTFSIAGYHVSGTGTDAMWTGKLKWLGESDRSLRDVLEAGTETAETRTATGEAAGWLVDFLTSQGGAADSADVKDAGRKAGHSVDALKRARARAGVSAEPHGFPRRTVWVLASGSNGAGASSRSSLGESALTALTAPTDGPDPDGTP